MTFQKVFGRWPNGLLTFVERFCRSAVASAFCVCRETFWGTICLKTINLVFMFCVLSQKKFGVCQKYFKMVVVMAVQMSRGTFMGRNPIPEKLCIFKIVSGFSANCLWTNAKNISAELPHLHCNGADDFFLNEIKRYSLFLTWAKNCFPVRK